MTLGKVDKNDFEPSDERGVTVNDVHDDYALLPGGGPENDVALLTLSSDAPAGLDPLRLIEPGESALWADGVTATVIGWGDTEGTGPTGFPGLSDELLEATVPMRSDAYCGDDDVWDTDFRAASMVCAGGGETDTCGGDSGGPLMVGDGSFLVLAGITSWGANDCATPDLPGVYTRLGAPALNAWVRERVPMARASVSDATVEPGQSATFSATASGGITSFAWDFDGDGDTDATGANVSHAYPASGRFVARVVAGGVATDKVRVQVGDGITRDPEPTPTPDATPRHDHAARHRSAARHDAAGRHAPRPARHAARVQRARASAAGASPCACASRPARRPGPRSSRSSARAARSASRGRAWSAVGHGGCA